MAFPSSIGLESDEQHPNKGRHSESPPLHAMKNVVQAKRAFNNQQNKNSMAGPLIGEGQDHTMVTMQSVLSVSYNGAGGGADDTRRNNTGAAGVQHFDTMPNLQQLVFHQSTLRNDKEVAGSAEC